jgi:hypothetical protein
MSKKRKGEASAEEQEIMRRAEAKAAGIDTKPSTVGYNFDEEAEKQRVMEAKKPGVTVVNAEEQEKKESLAEDVKRLEKRRQEALNIGADEARNANYDLMQSKLALENAPSGTQTFTAGQVANSEALQNILKDENQDVAINSALSADSNTKTEILGSITDPNTTFEDINNIENTADEAKEQIQKQQTNLVNANSTVLNNLGQEKDKPTYDRTATKDDINKQIDNSMASYGANAPTAIIEKLGVQDYYPQVGRDVAVGNFTGSRIGSQTIYSGAGALLPMGLYDARKRALAEAAKERQKTLEKFLNIPDAPDQLNLEFGQYAGNIILDIAKKNNYDPSLIPRDKQGMLELKRLENTAKELHLVDKTIGSLIDKATTKDGGVAGYIPEKMKNEMYKFKSGLLDDMQDYFSGKKDIGNLTNNLRIYADGTKWINEMLPKWTDESNKTQRPVSLKTGLTIGESDVAKIQETIKAINEGSGDYDSNVTLLKKYFSIDEKLVDDWCDLQGYPKDDLARESLKQYFEKQIPEASFIEEVKSLSNKNYDYWKTRGDWAREDEKAKTFFTRLQDEADKRNIPGKVSGIYVNSSAWNTMMSEDSKQNRLASIYEGLGVVTKNSKNKKDAYALINVDSKSAFAAPVNISTSNQNATIQLKRADGKKEWVNLNTAAKYLQKDGNTAWIGGVKYTIPKDSDDYTAIKNFKNNDVIQVIDNAKEIRAGHYGSDGNLYNLSTDNMNNYLSSNKKTIVVTVEGNVGVWRDVKVGVDEKGNPIYEKQIQKSSANVRYAGDNNDKQFRDIIDVTQGQAQQRMAGGEFNYAPAKP